MSSFQCQVQQQSGAVVCHLAGTLGAADVSALEQTLNPALGNKSQRVVLELSSLAMLGSAGVGALLKLRREVTEAGGKLVLVALPATVQKILVHSGLGRFFVTAADIDSALQH